MKKLCQNMIHAFYDIDDIMDEENVNDRSRKDEDMLRGEANIKLFEGATTSRIATCLMILDLQATHGWSDKSVSSLLMLL